MTLLRKVAVVCALLLGIGLVAGAGFYLSRTQADARESVLRAFDERARLAANLTGDTLLASDPKTREWASSAYSGPAAGLPAKLRAGLDPSMPWLVILSESGALLGASSDAAGSRSDTLAADPGFQRATQTGVLTFGDVVTDDGVPWVYAYQPYSGESGARVLVVPNRVSDVGRLMHTGLDVTGGRSYIVDSTGVVIVASDNAEAGRPIPDPALAAAADRVHRGQAGDAHFVTYPVAGSNWRTVIAASRSTLLAPYHQTARSAWYIFAAFATAVLLILVIGASIVVGSSRVARARLYDQLTGLPGRSLFLNRTEAAIDRWRRRESPSEGPVAALFLDLDGFKPVNDTYGHAAGDALLGQVARRLVEATRPEDYVGRFGGDEFLVLCRGLHREDDGYAVADRILHYLSEPFEVMGHQVRIGVSIGIATVGEHADHAESLIRNADLALYRAKHTGRGRIERFTPEMADA